MQTGTAFIETPRKILVVIFDGALLLNVAGPIEAFSLANRELDARRGGSGGHARHPTNPASPAGGPIRTSSDIELNTLSLPDPVSGSFDTIALVGGMGMRAMSENRQLIDWVRAAAPRARRIASFGSAAFMMARAGLLNGKRCSAHWRIADNLRNQFPLVEVETEALFVRDGHVLTAAGSIASIDLALNMIEEDHGKALALMVARVLVMPRMRPGDQPQLSAELRAQTAATPRVATAAEWIVTNIDRRPTVASLADRFAMSERNFSRVFTKEMGMSPQRFIESARLEAARRWLAGSSLPIDSIARRSGYSSGEHFAQSFKKTLGTTPGDYRREAHQRAGEPH